MLKSFANGGTEHDQAAFLDSPPRMEYNSDQNCFFAGSQSSAKLWQAFTVLQRLASISAHAVTFDSLPHRKEGPPSSWWP
jgi:hypothetical protein